MNERREKPLKRLAICPACTGYMRPIGAVQGQQVGGRHWKDESYTRSFGGKEIKRFICEKCGQEETFQIDDLEFIGEDD